jgi:hypothetical protein
MLALQSTKSTHQIWRLKTNNHMLEKNYKTNLYIYIYIYIIFQNDGCGNQFCIKEHGVSDFQVGTYHGHDVWQGEDKFIL